MRLCRLLLFVATLLLTITPASSQFSTEGNLAWSYMGGMPANIPWLASAVFAPTDAGNMALRGPVSTVTAMIGTESGSVTTVRTNFDAHGNQTAFTILDPSGEDSISTRHEYTEQLESVVRSLSVTSVGGPAAVSLRRQYTYDQSGKLIRSEGPGWGNLATVKLEYQDGKPLRATAELDGDSYALEYDTSGRLIERTEPGHSASITVTWTTDRGFEVHRLVNGEKVLEGRGTLDEHGSLREWSWQALTVERRLIKFRNEITYDAHSNWTKLVTYLEAAPGEELPSRSFFTAMREITYR